MCAKIYDSKKKQELGRLTERPKVADCKSDSSDTGVQIPHLPPLLIPFGDEGNRLLDVTGMCLHVESQRLPL